MADTLLQALTKYFHNDPALKTAFTVGERGSPWVGGAPEGSALPFVDLLHDGETPDYSFERGYRSIASFSLTVYAVGLATVETLAATVMTAFDAIIDDHSLLNITGAKCVGFYRKNYQVGREDVRDKSGNYVFHVVLPYEAWIRRELLA